MRTGKYDLSVLNDSKAWSVKVYGNCDCGVCQGRSFTARPACPNCRHTLGGGIQTLTEGMGDWIYQTQCYHCKATITLTDGMAGIV